MKPAKLRTTAMAAGAVAVTIAATAAVASLVSSPADPVSQDDADRLLSQTATPTTDTPTPAASATTTTGTGTTTSAGAGTTTSPRTSGTGSGDTVAHVTPGTVTIHCDGSLATLVSWSPNPGYVSRDTVRGPASQVSVKFESDIYDHYLVSATCSDGTATVQAVELDA